jgi:hypothetical protein
MLVTFYSFLNNSLVYEFYRNLSTFRDWHRNQVWTVVVFNALLQPWLLCPRTVWSDCSWDALCHLSHYLH